MNHTEQKAFADYLTTWLDEGADAPLRCPLCQSPVSKGPAYLKARYTMYQCVRRCFAISVEHEPLSEALFRVFGRVYEELRLDAAEHAPTVRPPPLSFTEIDARDRRKDEER